MKYLTQTTGALFFAGVAALLGGCGSSDVAPSASVVAYKADTQDPAALDKADLTLETAPAPVDPTIKEYAEKYNQMKKTQLVAKAPVAQAPAPQLPPPLADKEAIDQAKKRIAELKGSVKTAKNGAIIELRLESADTTVDDMKLIGRLLDLEKVFFLGSNFNDEYFAPLAELKNLKDITVQNSDITVATLQLFATFPELVSLDIRRDLKLTNQDLEVVAGMPKLEKLFAYYNSFGNSGMNKLAKSATLKVVDVRGCSDVSDNAAKYLAKIPNLEETYFRFLMTNDGVEKLTAAQNLKFVEFQDCNDLNASCVESLKKFPNLTGLRLFRNKGFFDDGVQALASMKLERLELRDMTIGNAGVLALKEMVSLKSLELSELQVDAAGLNELLAALKNLTTLTIFFLPANDETAKTIAASTPNLTSLTLRATQITDGAIDEILKLQNLETLDLRENASLTADAMMKLAQMKSLRKIYVKGTGFGSSDAASKRDEFKKANPKCSIAL